MIKLDRVLIALHLKKDPLWVQFKWWTKRYNPPGVHINFAYFVEVLGTGENEMAESWERRKEEEHGNNHNHHL